MGFSIENVSGTQPQQIKVKILLLVFTCPDLIEKDKPFEISSELLWGLLCWGEIFLWFKHSILVALTIKCLFNPAQRAKSILKHEFFDFSSLINP